MDDLKRMMEQIHREAWQVYTHVQYSRPEELDLPQMMRKIRAVRLLATLAEEQATAREESWRSGIERLKETQRDRPD